MEALACGILEGNDGPARFTTFANKNAFANTNNAGYDEVCEVETKVVGCVPLYLMATLLNEIKGEQNFKKILENGQEIGRAPGEDECIKERGYYSMMHWRKDKTGKERWDERIKDDWVKVNKTEHQRFSDMATTQINNFGTTILKGLGIGHITRRTHLLAPGIVHTEGSFRQAAHTDFDETRELHEKNRGCCTCHCRERD